MRPLTAEEWSVRAVGSMFRSSTIVRDTRDNSLWEVQYVQDQTVPVVVWLAEFGGGMYFKETTEELFKFYVFHASNNPCAMGE
jgi:hypothetical protein